MKKPNKITPEDRKENQEYRRLETLAMARDRRDHIKLVPPLPPEIGRNMR